MADESKQYGHFGVEITETQIIVTVKNNSPMKQKVLELPEGTSAALNMTSTVLPNGDIRLVRERNLRNRVMDIAFAHAMGVNPEALAPNPFEHLNQT